MCAIIDNNVRHEVFGAKEVQTEAGKHFLDWINNRKGKLVVGGKLLKELAGYSDFNRWFQQGLLAGSVNRVADDKVDAETGSLLSQNICKSNDAHVLALARVSGARLLFTNDHALQDDFKNPQLISGVRGRVYTTLQQRDVRRSHRDLLNRTDLCNS